MDNIFLARIVRIIDHEGFDGDGTLGHQVAQRLAPVFADTWADGWKAGSDRKKGWSDSGLDDNPFRTKAERQRAVFEVMDLEDELEAQERS